jgi:transcriptional regulator with XRE-family HTH domain
MTERRASFINKAPSEYVAQDTSKEVAKAEFARRLNRLMNKKGWNQSVLAREAAKHAPAGISMTRDKVSNYIRGKNIPSPAHLALLCSALECEPEDLVPVRGVPEAGEKIRPSELPAFEVSAATESTAWLRINQVVPWSVATQIMQILKVGETDKN